MAGTKGNSAEGSDAVLAAEASEEAFRSTGAETTADVGAGGFKQLSSKQHARTTCDKHVDGFTPSRRTPSAKDGGAAMDPEDTS